MAGIGNDLVREARKRVGLTQRELAERAGTTQSAIARIETGRSTPSFDTVLRLLRLCGLDLDIMLVERDDSDIAQAEAHLRMTVQERADFNTHVVRTMTELQQSVAKEMRHAS
jgi:transcriptional regulator with XRE-family HTH domain